MGLTYTYDSGAISHYAIKKAENSCHEDKDRTRLIGVMCKGCKHYLGIRKEYDEDINPHYYVLCEWHEKDDEDDTGMIRELRGKIYENIQHNALCALDG